MAMAVISSGGSLHVILHPFDALAFLVFFAFASFDALALVFFAFACAFVAHIAVAFPFAFAFG